MPKKQVLYYKNRPLLLAKLSCVKKQINKILNKSFICKLILPTTALLFFAMKPGGGI